MMRENGHWTTHVCPALRGFRDARPRGDEGYAREELVAEPGAAFMCADLGLTPEVHHHHASYIASWLTALKERQARFSAPAAHAQWAVDFLHCLQPDASTPPA
jgi:antirestriction protein ArdC